MKSGKKSTMKSSHTAFLSNADRKRDDVIKKITVLFTDITGSTDFFKSYGNVAGRQMLHQHESIVSNTITEFGGTVVKNIGDSVMGYFLEPRETVKAAITIQEKFHSYNRKTTSESQIHIRIGIHFGEGIVEDRDIFGDVVNVASKLTNLAGGDEIFISQELFTEIQNLTKTRFDLIDVSDINGTPQGLTVYKVIWEDDTDFKPLTNTVVCLRPVWELGIVGFDKIWAHIFEEKERIWGSKAQGEKILPDQSIILIVTKPVFALEVVFNILSFLREHLNKGQNLHHLPIQIVIDTGPYLRTDTLTLKSFKVKWEELNPGSVHISRSTHTVVTREEDGSFVPVPLKKTNSHQDFIEVAVENNSHKSDLLLFLYQDALVQGKKSPCFYCGGRNHTASDCPSKNLTELTATLNHLGYVTFDAINDLFFRYLGVKDQRHINDLKAIETDNNLPFYGFYELKQVFQLRFFKNIWDAETSDWTKVTKIKAGGEGKGGFVWLAQDCIRVSNLTHAESLLSTCLEKYPQDYKVYCAMGFLNIEKNKNLSAEYYFSKALSHADTKPQKIFILLLLSRLFFLNSDLEKAMAMIKEINYINSSSSEVVYQDIIFKFNHGRTDIAMRRLLDLILNDRSYFIHALIDPDLAPYSKRIHPKLKKIFLKTREQARTIMHETEQALVRYRRMFGDRDSDVEKMDAMMSEVDQLSTTDSYFGYLDILHQCRIIKTMCQKEIERRERECIHILDKLNERLQKDLSIVSNFHFHFFIDSAHEGIGRVTAEMDQLQKEIISKKTIPYGELLLLLSDISKKMDKLDQRISRLRMMDWFALYFSTFFRNAFIILAAILFAGTIIFPNMIYYVDILMPQFDIPKGGDVWQYQKSFILFGIIGGVLLSACKSLKGMLKQ